MASDPGSVTPQDAAPEAMPAQASSTSDERTMALLCHLGGILTGFIIPLIVWLIKKDQSRFVDDQGKEALNFQLTLLIAYALGGFTSCFLVGIFIIIAAWIMGIIFGIMGSIAASKGQNYRYPLNIRFIK
jgi:uncharacterized Tic20 family protein